MPTTWMTCPHCHARYQFDGISGTRCSGCGAALESSPDAAGGGQWFYIQGRQKVGPVTWATLQQQAAAGRLQPGDMVLRAGTQKWVAGQTIAGLFPSTEALSPRTEASVPAPELLSGTEAQVGAPLPSPERMSGSVTQGDSSRPEPALPAVAGYEILGVLGKGGMGVVYRARQEKLKRVVALKMVLAGEHANAAELGRFRIEAEAVARLQHPNIVQIYEVGEHNGLPYLSLEFVEGGSLRQRLTGTPLPSRHVAQLIETLARAMHHAHQHGIVHRDLKPGNVLLTSIGGPKIADFGLAKQLNSDDNQTKTGSILGTPNYIAPEQAAGKGRQVGPAADIYSLGAILYEMLTGRPPFRGESSMDTLLQVLSVEPPPPSQISAKVPRDLEIICLKCLEKQPHKRYATAEALADDLRHFLDGEPIQARAVSSPERFWRWCRRRPLVAGLLTALVLAMLGGLGGIIWQWRRADEQRRIAETRLVELQRQQAETEEQRRRSEENFRQARAVVDEFFTRVSQNKLLDQPGMHSLRKDLLESAQKYYQKFLEQQKNDPSIRAELGATLIRLGQITHQIGSKADALAAYQQAHALEEQLLQADPANATARNDLATCQSAIGRLRHELGQSAEAMLCLQKASALSEELARAEPGNPRYQSKLAASHAEIARVLRDTGKPAEALRFFQKSRDIVAQLVRADPRNVDGRSNLAAIDSNIGQMQHAAGQLPEALRSLQQAHDIIAQLARDRTTSIQSQRDLAASLFPIALVYRDLGKTAEALRLCQQARDILEPLAQANPAVSQLRHDVADVHNTMGILHHRSGAHAEALHAYQQAQGTFEQLVRDDANVVQWQRDLAGGFANIANVQRDLGQPAEALRAHQQASEQLRRLVQANPTLAFLQNDLAIVLNNIGTAYCEGGQQAEGIRSFQEAAALWEKLIRAEPDTLNYRSELGRTLSNIGHTLEQQGHVQEALRAYQQSSEHLGVVFTRAAQAKGFRSQLSIVYVKLARLQRALGRPGEAAATSAKRRALWPADASELYQVACELALCVPLVGKGKPDRSPGEQAEQRMYADQAVAVLRQAIQAGYRDVAQLKKDPKLDALRMYADFNALLAELEKKSA